MTYKARLFKALQCLDLPPGTVAVAEIKHDPKCPGARGCPVCRCSPNIEIETPGGKIKILPDGSIQSAAALN